jgi:hypothetical protein
MTEVSRLQICNHGSKAMKIDQQADELEDAISKDCSSASSSILMFQEVCTLARMRVFEMGCL